MTNSQQRNVLSGLREAQEALRRDEQQVARLVAAAREYGISWQSIGKVLGISKQAAWERFGRGDPHPTRLASKGSDAGDPEAAMPRRASCSND